MALYLSYRIKIFIIIKNIPYLMIIGAFSLTPKQFKFNFK